MKKIARFLLISSGADLRILAQCRTDQSKYIGIGGTVFFTGLMAALAAAYALFTVFDSYWVAIPLGLVWGLMIFNLDRFIVSGMRKEERIGRELLTALPRIVLAVILSMVIAKPFELKIFAKEIETELVKMEQQTYATQEAEARSRFEPTLVQRRQQVAALQKEVADKAAQRNALLQLAQQEADGTGGSKVKNLGPIYLLKKADAQRADAELNTLTKANEAKISLLDTDIRQTEAAMNLAITTLAHTPMNGLAARVEALSRLTATSAAMWWAHLFILLLFIMLECSPILVKLFSQKGPYDSLLHAKENEYRSREIESIAITNAETKRRTAHLATTEQNYVTRKLDAELL